MSKPRTLISAFGACAVVLLTAYSNSGTTRRYRRRRAPRRWQFHHRRRAAEPGAERHPQLGRAARRPEVGHERRHRHRSEGRQRLGLRTLRRGHGRRRSRRLRQQPGRSGVQVRSPHGQGARQHRQGRDGDAARHPRGSRRQRVGRRLRREQGRHQGPPGPQVQPDGQKLLSLGQAGKPGNADGQFNQPNDVVIGPDGSIYVSDGHNGQGMTTAAAIAEGIKRGDTARISKFSRDGKFIKSWGTLGVRHGEFRTPHAMVFDAKGRLWVADRGNHRLEIFDQEGKYLESRYAYGRISGLFIRNNTVYAIDSESSPLNHVELAQRRAHRSARRGSHHRVHSALRARGSRAIRARRAKASRSTRTATSTPRKGRTR